MRSESLVSLVKPLSETEEGPGVFFLNFWFAWIEVHETTALVQVRGPKLMLYFMFQCPVGPHLCHGWECSSVVECVSSMHKDLDSVPSIKGKKLPPPPTKNIMQQKESGPGEILHFCSWMDFFHPLAPGLGTGEGLIAGEKRNKKTLHACFPHSKPLSLQQTLLRD